MAGFTDCPITKIKVRRIGTCGDYVTVEDPQVEAFLIGQLRAAEPFVCVKALVRFELAIESGPSTFRAVCGNGFVGSDRARFRVDSAFSELLEIACGPS